MFSNCHWGILYYTVNLAVVIGVSSVVLFISPLHQWMEAGVLHEFSQQALIDAVWRFLTTAVKYVSFYHIVPQQRVKCLVSLEQLSGQYIAPITSRQKESARWMKFGSSSCIKTFLFCILNLDDKCISKEEKKNSLKESHSKSNSWWVFTKNKILDKVKLFTLLRCMHIFWVFQILHFWYYIFIDYLTWHSDRIMYTE